MEFEAVIGLEVHAQLLTQSKLFCGCSTRFGAKPNSQTCPVCLGLPGVLPVLNEQAVNLAIRAGLALHCEIQLRSIWARKNYFYPDLPKGYQISQFEKPLALRGHLDIVVNEKPYKIHITRIHMEEDAGKLLHEHGDEKSSHVDLNRAGTPLVEIVSEPDIRSALEAGEYLRSLRAILQYCEVCDGNMEEGSLRCDANVSIRPIGQKEFGTRTELKNINSFRYVEKAIEYEIKRQKACIEAGEKIVQESRICSRFYPVLQEAQALCHAHTGEDARKEKLEAACAKRSAESYFFLIGSAPPGFISCAQARAQLSLLLFSRQVLRANFPHQWAHQEQQHPAVPPP